MSINLDNINNISGPVAVVKLEGEIEGKKKEILLFGDYHYQMINQNECQEYDSISIKQFLINVFKNTKKPIDFFLEISPSMYETVSQEDKNYVDIYLNNLRYFFVKEMKKPTFEKIRFQYSDIRNILYTILHDFLFDNQIIENITRSRNIYLSEIEFLIKKAEIVSHSVNIIILALKSNREQFNKLTKQEKKANPEIEVYMKNIRKLVFDIDSKEVKNQIRIILKKSLVGIIESMNKIIKQLNIIKNRIEKQNSYSYYEIDKTIYKLGTDVRKGINMAMGFYVLVTDIYTIRRMLDKKYVNTAIYYGGAQHMTNILNILVNNFGFKVKDQFSQDKDLIKIDRNYIEKYYKVYNFDSLAEKSNPILEQCVNISKFKNSLI